MASRCSPPSGRTERPAARRRSEAAVTMVEPTCTAGPPRAALGSSLSPSRRVVSRAAASPRGGAASAAAAVAPCLHCAPLLAQCSLIWTGRYYLFFGAHRRLLLPLWTTSSLWSDIGQVRPPHPGSLLACLRACVPACLRACVPACLRVQRAALGVLACVRRLAYSRACGVRRARVCVRRVGGVLAACWALCAVGVVLHAYCVLACVHAVLCGIHTACNIGGRKACANRPARCPPTFVNGVVAICVPGYHVRAACVRRIAPAPERSIARAYVRKGTRMCRCVHVP